MSSIRSTDQWGETSLITPKDESGNVIWAGQVIKQQRGGKPKLKTMPTPMVLDRVKSDSEMLLVVVAYYAFLRYRNVAADSYKATGQVRRAAARWGIRYRVSDNYPTFA